MLQSFLGNILLGWKLRIDTKIFNFWHFWERPLYEISECAFKEMCVSVLHFTNNYFLFCLISLQWLWYQILITSIWRTSKCKYINNVICYHKMSVMSRAVIEIIFFVSIYWRKNSAISTIYRNIEIQNRSAILHIKFANKHFASPKIMDSNEK